MLENTKTETMSLFDLGEEYERHAELQNVFIKSCKAEIEKAKESGDFFAVAELEKKLNKFCTIKRELKKTALKLKTYYKGEKYES